MEITITTECKRRVNNIELIVDKEETTIIQIDTNNELIDLHCDRLNPYLITTYEDCPNAWLKLVGLKVDTAYNSGECFFERINATNTNVVIRFYVNSVSYEYRFSPEKKGITFKDSKNLKLHISTLFDPVYEKCCNP